MAAGIINIHIIRMNGLFVSLALAYASSFQYRALPNIVCIDCDLLWFGNSWFAYTVYPKKYAHGFCFAVLCCGYTLTDFPISIRLTSLALWQSNDCPSASKATLMNIDKYFMWIHYERLHNHNKAKHNKTVCIFLGIYSIYQNFFIMVRAHLAPLLRVFMRSYYNTGKLWGVFIVLFRKNYCHYKTAV